MSHKVSFRFHGELNYFLSRQQRSTHIHHTFTWRSSVKDMLESLGPPHCEVEQIIVNERAVDFDYLVTPDDEIEVYDRAETVNVAPLVPLRPPLEGKPRFILDTHLGRLASYLRMMGFDTLYRNDYADDELAFVSHTENRILLSRDLGCLKRSLVVYGRYMRATNPKQQIVEVLRRFQLAPLVTPFAYCIRCNGVLQPVEKERVLDLLPADTALYYDQFHQCHDCAQVYWKGSHYDRMQEFMAEVIAKDSIAPS